MAATVTVLDMWNDSKRSHVLGSIALTGNYATGGISLNFVTAALSSIKGQTALPGISKQPLRAAIDGIAGYKYEYDRTNKKLIIRQSAGATPAGTINTPTITVTEGDVNIATGAPATNTSLGLTVDTVSGALTKTSAGALAIPRATLFGSATTAASSALTFTGTAIAAGAMAELPASALPAGVTGDTIQFYLIFKG